MKPVIPCDTGKLIQLDWILESKMTTTKPASEQSMTFNKTFQFTRSRQRDENVVWATRENSTVSSRWHQRCELGFRQQTTVQVC